MTANDGERIEEARALLSLLVAYDSEPCGIMDAIDNDGQPYQSEAMAGLIAHARAWLEPDAVADRVALYRAYRNPTPTEVSHDPS